ncbi:P-loop containing nucleoside triphosphate hydrolase protein [Blastocladiella britannica]|nr:P-loop containing nucleoside triphosphate hydrolase protein [Blastocladiella britannica]
MAETVKVVLRCRPFSEKEKAAGHSCIVKMDEPGNSVAITDPNAPATDPPKSFGFDAVFDSNCRQRDVYDKTALPIVESALAGYNGTIFAYGQTGTGKTFSMEGVRDVPDLRGIIPNAFEHVFTHIRAAPPGIKFLVRASYLEIYNEEIRDLLASGITRLELKEHPESGVYVKDLSSFVVKDGEEMDKLMNQGNKNRSVGFTEMNARSSRSHSIFTITIEMSEERDGKECIRMGKLNLVDLAGSERQSKTGATGDRLKEATKINLSLSCLGNVIKALVDGKSSHIPYRDSKLTRLLQDSLGGNAKTMMIATMSPASYNYEETISTLRYAARAKNIKNKPKVNEDPKDAMLRMFQEEISRLRAQLEADGGGGGGMLSNAGSAEFGDDDDHPDDGDGDESGDETSPDGDANGQDASTAAATRSNGSLKRHGGGATTRKKPVGGLSLDEMQVMEQRIEEEKRRILESTTMIESEKKALLAQLKTRQIELEAERSARAELASKLEQMESKLLVGGVNLLDKEVEQREELVRKAAELEDRKRAQYELQQQMAHEAEAALAMEEEYASLQEAAAAKTAKIKKMWTLLMSHKAELNDLTGEYQREREDLLDTIRELARDLKKKMLLVDRFVPPRELAWIEANAAWDEVNERWHIRHAMQSGNHFRGPRAPPESAPGTSAHQRHLAALNGNLKGNTNGGSGGGGNNNKSVRGGSSIGTGRMGMELEGWSSGYPTPTVYLSYEGAVRNGSGSGAGGALSPGGSKARKSGASNSSISGGAGGSAMGPHASGRSRPQAARAKSGTRSGRPVTSGEYMSAMEEAAGGASSGGGRSDDIPMARGLVSKPRHYA